MLKSVAACVDMPKKKTEGRVKSKIPHIVGNFLSLDVEYLINEYDGCERPKDLQSNFGMETIRTLSDEET